MWLHRFAVLVSGSTVLLIAAGGLVTSTASGLAVPDWPTTYGWSMYSFPLDKMVGGILYEHGHRLIASGVGMLTIVLAVWLWLTESRPSVRRLGLFALAAVIAQGLLGGLTVRFFLPAPISIAHAGLAQFFFCLTISIALFTSRGWRAPPRAPFASAEDRILRRIALATTVLIYAQILVGATMRHTGAGLAIPDFPLVFGGLLPPEWTAGIVVHYTHRVGALAVLLGVLATAGHVLSHHRHSPELTRPAVTAVLLVLVQIALGGLTVLSGRAVSFNTAHVVSGALLLATSLVITLRAWRAWLPSGDPLDLSHATEADLSDAQTSVGVGV